MLTDKQCHSCKAFLTNIFERHFCDTFSPMHKGFTRLPATCRCDSRPFEIIRGKAHMKSASEKDSPQSHKRREKECSQPDGMVTW
jgi:hypothetical protein